MQDIKISKVTDKRLFDAIAYDTDLHSQLVADWWRLIDARYMDVLVAMADSDYTVSAMGRLAIIKDARVNPTGLHVLSLYVAYSQRRKGVASRLLESVDVLSVEQGVGVVSLDVARSNEGAIKLYEKHGYSITDDSSEDDVISMQKCVTG